MQDTHDISHLTAADVFRAPGVQTPLITRFSTVIHERGSPETLRDPRGFAVRHCCQCCHFSLEMSAGAWELSPVRGSQDYLAEVLMPYWQ